MNVATLREALLDTDIDQSPHKEGATHSLFRHVLVPETDGPSADVTQRGALVHIRHALVLVLDLPLRTVVVQAAVAILRALPVIRVPLDGRVLNVSGDASRGLDRRGPRMLSDTF